MEIIFYENQLKTAKLRPYKNHWGIFGSIGPKRTATTTNFILIPPSI